MNPGISMNNASATNASSRNTGAVSDATSSNQSKSICARIKDACQRYAKAIGPIRAIGVGLMVFGAAAATYGSKFAGASFLAALPTGGGTLPGMAAGIAIAVIGVLAFSAGLALLFSVGSHKQETAQETDIDLDEEALPPTVLDEMHSSDTSYPSSGSPRENQTH